MCLCTWLVDGALIGGEKCILNDALLALLDPTGAWFMRFKVNSLKQLFYGGQKSEACSTVSPTSC